MILVVDNNKTAYVEKYKLFYNAQDAIKCANSLGFSKYSFIGLSEEDLVPGMLHHVNAGKDCNIEVIKIVPEISTSKNNTLDHHIGWGGC